MWLLRKEQLKAQSTGKHQHTPAVPTVAASAHREVRKSPAALPLDLCGGQGKKQSSRLYAATPVTRGSGVQQDTFGAAPSGGSVLSSPLQCQPSRQCCAACWQARWRLPYLCC